MSDTERPSHSEAELTLAARLALQTIAIDALVVELRKSRTDARPSVQALWHTAVAAVVATCTCAGFWYLVPTGLAFVK